MGELIDFLVEKDPNFRSTRLPALYSDFRSQQTTNPDGFHANVRAWRQALELAAWESRLSMPTSSPSLLVIPVDDRLISALESRRFGRPLALATVLREAVADRTLLPLPEFMRARESIYHRWSWAALPWTAITWAARQIGLVGSDQAVGRDSTGEKLPKGQFVAVGNVERAGKALVEGLEESLSRFDRVLSRAQFQKRFQGSLTQGKSLSNTDVDVLLKFLSRDKHVVEYDGNTIKINSDGDGAGLGISEEDKAIASLKDLIEQLRMQTKALEQRLEQHVAEAKQAIQKKNSVAAKAAIRSKKMTEGVLATRFDTLSQLETIAAKVQQASDQVQLVKVMDASAGVLRSLNTQIGGTERVDEVMERLREQMGVVDEVGEIIAADAQTAEGVNDSEIEAELDMILSQEQKKKEEAEAEAEKKKDAELEQFLAGLESVPTGIPREPLERVKTPATPATKTVEDLSALSLGQAGENDE